MAASGGKGRRDGTAARAIKRGKHTLERLTAKAVEQKRKPGAYADGGGLYLQVGPEGTKAWIFRYMREGRARKMGLGPLGTVTLAEAREAARDARKLLLQKIDPIDARAADEAAKRVIERKAKTFRECAEAYIDAHKDSWTNKKHAAQWGATLKAYCYPDPPARPVWNDLPISAIDTGMVLEVISPLWKTKTETASRLRGRIESILDWATIRGYREGLNPARWKGHLDKTLPKRSKVQKVRHQRALAFDAVPGFLAVLREQDALAARLLEFITLTAVRTSEAIGATWEEVDFDAKVWTIPAERMKAKREHKVPLSAAALSLLRALHRNSTSAYVFPSPMRKAAPLSNMACLQLLERMGKRGDTTVHGMRSSFRDWAAERTSFTREVAEMALAHVIENKVEAAYRRGDLFDKRRKMMDAWAAFCAQPATTGTVVPIRKKARA